MIFVQKENLARIEYRMIEDCDMIADTHPHLVGDIYISGFHCAEPGKGHGSLLLHNFLKAAKQGQFVNADGTLPALVVLIPWCGFGQQERLRAFYKSFGFFKAGDYWEYQLPLWGQRAPNISRQQGCEDAAFAQEHRI